MELHIVYRRNGPTLLTKKHYADWREIQDEFADYTTSLGPWTVEEVIDFWQTEYPGACPADLPRIEAFCQSGEETLEFG